MQDDVKQISEKIVAKAIGQPIAKVAAKLAVGYTLDELDNDITKVTPASFEPTIDYVVTKIPKFAFEKFPGAKPDRIRPQLTGLPLTIGKILTTADGIGGSDTITAGSGNDILVGGTNGKGSSVEMLRALLAGSGVTGTYTSPHVLRYNERIAVAGRPAADSRRGI